MGALFGLVASNARDFFVQTAKLWISNVLSHSLTKFNKVSGFRFKYDSRFSFYARVGLLYAFLFRSIIDRVGACLNQV